MARTLGDDIVTFGPFYFGDRSPVEELVAGSRLELVSLYKGSSAPLVFRIPAPLSCSTCCFWAVLELMVPCIRFLTRLTTPRIQGLLRLWKNWITLRIPNEAMTGDYELPPPRTSWFSASL